MEIEAELSKIVINETVDQQIIVLKERGGDRSFPIVIGMPEILAINRRLKGIQLPRPLTHDLLANTIIQLGGEIIKIVISDLSDHTFYANLYVNLDGKIVLIDSRPSDALAISAGTDIPLYIDEQVFEKMKQ
ncbi:hypothetical protein LCGC14_2730460 [marine sediment metagenome]|uniref:BFN domain-containing protein n=1 Tax=marine sediment metagenome TaxID=412755 RepID=A0A0F9BZ40_9ZZZZ|nr:bifunctional nuclease family protein [Phycisphaerales bacterium]